MPVPAVPGIPTWGVPGVRRAAAPLDVPFLDGFTPVTLNMQGGWTWYTDPRAVVSAGNLYAGALDAEVGGDVVVHELDLTTGALVTVDLADNFQKDDHNNPALLALADGSILAFYSRHGADTEIRIRKTTNPGDGSAWNASYLGPAAVATSYNNPFRLSAESDRIYTFWRDNYTGPHWSWSDDAGATWTTKQKVIAEPTGERPYTKYWSDGVSRIDIWITDGHPREMAAGTNNVYHCYYTAGEFFQTDGTLIGDTTDLPLALSALTKVHDAATMGGNGWTHNITRDGSGNPVASYAVFLTADDHRYRYARWTGTAWERHEICAGGHSLYGPAPTDEEEYSGGVHVDHRDTRRVWLSRQVDTAEWDIEQWVTGDGGASWSSAKVTEDTGLKNFRPYVPVGATDEDLGVLWVAGPYTTYTDYHNVLKVATAQTGLGAWLEDEWSGASTTTIETARPGATTGWADHPSAVGDAVVDGVNGMTYNGTGTCAYMTTEAMSSADVDVSLVVTLVTDNNSASGGVLARLSPTVLTGYCARYATASNSWEMFKFVGGTATALGTPSTSMPPTTANPRRMTLRLRGNTQALIVDGVTLVTASDTAIPDLGRVGLRFVGNHSAQGLKYGRFEARYAP